MAKEILRDVGDRASWGTSDNLTCWEALMGVEQTSQLRGPHRAIQSSISTQGPSWGPPARRGPAWTGSASPSYKEAVMSASGSPPGSWALRRPNPDRTHAFSAHCQSALLRSTHLERRPLSEAAQGRLWPSWFSHPVGVSCVHCHNRRPVLRRALCRPQAAVEPASSENLSLG